MTWNFLDLILAGERGAHGLSSVSVSELDFRMITLGMDGWEEAGL